MKTMRQLPYFIFFMMLAGCGKKDSPVSQTTSIDVSKQWWFDVSGVMLTGPGDSQWQSTTFTAQELSLFTTLDTANLTGTTVPPQVLERNDRNAIYPNPFIFSASHAMSFGFPNGYSGQFVLKLVYVDSLMNPLFKKAIRLQANAYAAPTPSNVGVYIIPQVPVGRHRLYYMLCAASNPRFYTCWGNVECKQ